MTTPVNFAKAILRAAAIREGSWATGPVSTVLGIKVHSGTYAVTIGQAAKLAAFEMSIGPQWAIFIETALKVGWNDIITAAETLTNPVTIDA